MATFKDACYHYKRINKLNNTVLKLGVNDTWRPSPPTKYKGWCLDCCQHTDLTYCRGCTMYHVCQWCSQYGRCFLDNEPHLLRMRTFKNEVTKDELKNLIDMYDTLFPMNQKIVCRFISNTRQHKCRNECMTQWYNHLLMPITLQSLAIELDGDIYYVFGYYDNMNSINQTPFSFTNLVDIYDKLLLDNVNFVRMSFLPASLQQEYALRYFSKSRFISEQRKCVNDSHFSINVLENLHNPNFKIQITRNCSEMSFDWNEACKLVKNAGAYFDILKTSHIEFYSVSTRCRIFTQCKLKIASKLIIPNYITSNHKTLATEVHNCEWCSVNNSYTVWNDFRIKKIYDKVFNFLRAFSKFNINIGHCSSQEKMYEYVEDVLNVCNDERWKTSIIEIFNCLEPVELDDVKYVLFNHEINWDVINVLVHSIGKVPQILTLENVITIIQSIIYEWFDIRYMRNTPMVTFTIDKLRRLHTGLKTVEDDSGISDVE
uniref:Non-structural protein 1 n=1 Tax=Rotavirus A (strain RVA/Human/Japan/KU/1995/G1P1A[8]) TaxID=10952 RepID=NSP1_ROTHK|nr:RecName: Full=Non-structural protein 1; Short=NSP1; AltName: Full=NCVP2; AltName: Full=Non-structural RNA-binding protein 53; Short=NS53 [Human rotavirus strain KU]BAA84966.1 NSP1 [Human rotavirus A]